MKVLITGGAGFLAVHLSRALHELDHRTVLLDMRGSFENVQVEGVTVEGSTTDTTLLSQLISDHDITHIVHLAALLTPACIEDPALGTSVNCVGTAAVFEAARRASMRRVVYASAMAALALGDDLPVGDDRPLEASTIYGLTKIFCERLAEIFRSAHDYGNLIGLRFGVVYGPGRVRGMVELPRLVERAALDDGAELEYPDYPGRIDWTYVADAVAAIVAVLEAEHLSKSVYNLAGDKRTVREAVDHLARRFPRNSYVPRPEPLPEAAWEFVTDALRKDTTFSAFTRLEDGLDLTANLARHEKGMRRIDLTP